MKISFREKIALFFFSIGFFTSAALIWPLLFGNSHTIPHVKHLLSASLIFLGLGCGVLTRHLSGYAIALLGALVATGFIWSIS
jgi:hypothetical protein